MWLFFAVTSVTLVTSLRAECPTVQTIGVRGVLIAACSRTVGHAIKTEEGIPVQNLTSYVRFETEQGMSGSKPNKEYPVQTKQGMSDSKQNMEYLFQNRTRNVRFETEHGMSGSKSKKKCSVQNRTRNVRLKTRYSPHLQNPKLHYLVHKIP